MSRMWLAIAAALAVAISISACGSKSSSSTSATPSTSSSSSSASIKGDGSTFAAPIYEQLGSELKSQGLTVNYQGVGSGQGVSDFTNKSVDFAGTDPPMKDDEIAALKVNGTAQYAIDVKLPGMVYATALHAPVHTGTPKNWNDAEIKSLNPGVNLPSSAITVVHRSDESGTTKGFTGFLQGYSPEWKSKVGSDKTVKWPTGTGAKGNDGVAAAIKQTPGAIGYVEQAYAIQNNFTYASVKNKSGKFVVPTLASVTASGEGVKVPADLRFTITDSPNATAYPISSQTFIVVYKDPCKAGASKSTAQGLVKFLNYVLGPGQATIKKLSYAPLPSAIDGKAQANVKTLTCNGSPIKG